MDASVLEREFLLAQDAVSHQGDTVRALKAAAKDGNADKVRSHADGTMAKGRAITCMLGHTPQLGPLSGSCASRLIAAGLWRAPGIAVVPPPLCACPLLLLPPPAAAASAAVLELRWPRQRKMHSV